MQKLVRKEERNLHCLGVFLVFNLTETEKIVRGTKGSKRKQREREREDIERQREKADRTRDRERERQG